MLKTNNPRPHLVYVRFKNIHDPPMEYFSVTLPTPLPTSTPPHPSDNCSLRTLAPIAIVHLYCARYSLSHACATSFSSARTESKTQQNIELITLALTWAKFRRRTSHEPNRMQMRKILCSPSLTFDSAHVKYGV